MEAGHPFPQFAKESAARRHPGTESEPECPEGELTLPTSYTDGPYRAQLITAIRNMSDFSRASDAVVAFEALRRLGYGEELDAQLKTKLSVTGVIGQSCNLKTLTRETEKAKEEILDGFYPAWRKLVQSN